MVNKWNDVRNNKNMKKEHKNALCSVTRILTQSSAQDSPLSALVVCLICLAIAVVYWHLLMHTCVNNPLSQFITAQEVDFLIISSLFSFLYLSSSITGELADEKFCKNHRLLLRTPTISYSNFSSIRALQLKKWISWLLAHYSHFFIFPVLLLEK